MSGKQLQKPAEQAIVETGITPMEMLQRAVDSGANVDQLTKLMDLQERWEANQAKKAYLTAMKNFKQNPPEIVKGKHVNYTSKKTGQTTDYWHATLDDVVDSVLKVMTPLGLDFHWETEQTEKGVKVACVITHEQGHSERISLTSLPDDSGGKNSIQAIGSAVTYLQRYTLLAIVGLAAIGKDDDGRAAAPEPEPVKMSPVRLRRIVEGLLEPTEKGEVLKLREAWDDLDNDERQFVWKQLRSWERSGIKALLSQTLDDNSSNPEPEVDNGFVKDYDRATE